MTLFKGHMVTFKLYFWRKTGGENPQVPLHALFQARAGNKNNLRSITNRA
jgi:hypothetical protein